MEEANTTIVVGLFFILRCLIPLLILLGISYLLKRIGLVPKTPESKKEGNLNSGINSEEGGLTQKNAA